MCLELDLFLMCLIKPDMQKTKLISLIAIVVMASAFTIYKAINWKVKEGYFVHVYKGGTKFISFTGLKATISFDEEHPENSKIVASVSSDPIVEGNKALYEGVKEKETLDTPNYPLIEFRSTSVSKKDKAYEATGDLTIKNVTKEVKINFTFENKVFKGVF